MNTRYSLGLLIGIAVGTSTDCNAGPHSYLFPKIPSSARLQSAINSEFISRHDPLTTVRNHTACLGRVHGRQQRWVPSPISLLPWTKLGACVTSSPSAAGKPHFSAAGSRASALPRAGTRVSGTGTPWSLTCKENPTCGRTRSSARPCVLSSARSRVPTLCLPRPYVRALTCKTPVPKTRRPSTLLQEVQRRRFGSARFTAVLLLAEFSWNEERCQHQAMGGRARPRPPSPPRRRAPWAGRDPGAARPGCSQLSSRGLFCVRLVGHQ